MCHPRGNALQFGQKYLRRRTESQIGHKTELRTEFAYLLAWPDEMAKSKAWDGFMADEEWAEIKRVTCDEHGKLVGTIEDRLLTPTSYSPPTLMT